MKTIFLIVATVLALSGCATPEVFLRYEVVEQKTFSVATFDESLLEPCATTPPPSVESYTAANRDRREAMLVSYAADVSLDNKRCSLDKATLKAMLVKQKAAIQKFNEDEEQRVKAITEGKTKETK